MDGHLGLDFEAAREHGIGLDEREAERPVSGHDVGDMRIEQAVDGTADQPVAEVVEGPLVLLEVGGGEPVADDHVVAVEHLGHHGGAVGGVVVVHVDRSIRQRGLEVAHHLADRDLLVKTRKKHRNGRLIILEHGGYYTCWPVPVCDT